MTDLDILMAGAVVSFLSVAGAYVAIRRRANDEPVRSFNTENESYSVGSPATQSGDAR